MRRSKPLEVGHQVVVRQPEAADHREAEEEAEEVVAEVAEGLQQVAGVIRRSTTVGTAIPTTSRVMAMAKTASLKFRTRPNSSLPRSWLTRLRPPAAPDDQVVGVGVAAMEGPVLRHQPVVGHPGRQLVGRDEGEAAIALGDAEQPHRQRLLGPVPGRLPPGRRRHLLDDQHPAGGQPGGTGSQQVTLDVGPEQVEDVDDGYAVPPSVRAVPRPVGQLAGRGDLEPAPVGMAAPLGRGSGRGDLGDVDVDAENLPVGGLERQVVRQQAVPAAHLQDAAGRRDGRGHRPHRAGRPAHPDVGPCRGRAAPVQRDHTGARAHRGRPGVGHEPAAPTGGRRRWPGCSRGGRRPPGRRGR